jgi:hypothetical protein
MTKPPKLTNKQVIDDAYFALVLLEGLVWRDKAMNVCGLKAGDAGDVHAIEKAIKSIRRYKRQKKAK